MMSDVKRRVYTANGLHTCSFTWSKLMWLFRSYYAGVALTPDDPEAGARIALQTMALMQVRGLLGSHAEVAWWTWVYDGSHMEGAGHDPRYMLAGLTAGQTVSVTCWMQLIRIYVTGLCC